MASVTPEMPTSPPPMAKMELPEPLTVRLLAPGPAMVRSWAMAISPLSVMVPVTLKLMVSPGAAAAI